MAKSNSEFKSIQKKLVAAVAMVLVASIMVVSSSYAWFTLSTAPEVTGIQTAVGSNGNLEMALRTQKDVGLIGTTDGTAVYPATNNYWGNLVDLSDGSYHLDSVALAPARLNVTLDTDKCKWDYVQYVRYSNAQDTYKENDAFGTDTTEKIIKVVSEAGSFTVKETVDGKEQDVTYTHKHTITTNKEELVRPAYKLNGTAGTDIAYLQTPVYGTDGRLSALTTDSVINGTYLPEANGFAEQKNGSWGVRAIGTTSALTPAEMALRTAKRAVSAAITSSQTDAATSLRVDAVELANILINQELTSGYKISDGDVAAIQKALGNLDSIADSLENAMKQAVLAVSVAQGETLTAADITFGDGDITAAGIDWTGLKEMEATLKEAAKTLHTMRSEITTAVSHAKTAADADEDTTDGLAARKTAVTNAMSALLRAEDFKIVDSRNGTEYSVSAIKTLADTAPITAAGVLMNNPIISIKDGIYHDIALFSGNYSAEAIMNLNVKYGEMDLSGETLYVTMSTDADEPTYSYTNAESAQVQVTGFYLKNVLSQLNSVTVTSTENAQEYKIITDIYGYAIDLAFRTNAANSNLLLQTDAANRVEDSTLTQGGGSYMQFTKGNQDFTWEQLVNLMQSVRVVFISDTGSIYGVAAMQGLTYTPVVVPDTYETREETTGETTVTYHIQNDGSEILADDQHTDHTNCKVKTTKPVKYAADTAGHDLADENGNAITLTGCTVVTVGEGEDAVTYIKAPLKLYGFTVDAGGKMTIGAELGANALTALQQNVATAVTSLVYLDGDTVENADVAISGNSMTGTMNLQFASDATLDPMDYTFTETKLEKPTVAFDNATKTLTITDHADNPAGVVYKLYTTIADKEVNLNKTVTSGTVIDNNTITVPDGTLAATYTVYLKAEKNGFTASDAVNAFNITVVEGGTYTVSAVSGGQ